MATNGESTLNDDPRLGDFIHLGPNCTHNENTCAKKRISLLGFPYDEGVRRNGGRVGAAEGPKSMRKLLQKTGTVKNPEFGIDLSEKICVNDAGNVPTDLSLEEAHLDLESRVYKILQSGSIPFVIGGGNDQSYPNARALLAFAQQKEQTIAVINIDAHLDVRPLNNGQVHSGSPFRLLLDDDRFTGKNFVEFAVQGSQCSAVHANFVKQKNGRIFWLKDIRHDPAKHFEDILDSFHADHIFVSIDLDSVQSSDAPGVSAPGVVGLTSSQALDIAFAAGRHPRVRLVDLSEFNPRIDEYRTGKLVAMMFYHFLLGVAVREEK